MKKIGLFLMLALFQMLGYSQEKHITFTDSIRVMEALNIDYFKVASVPSYGGYYLSALFEDETGELKHYVGRTDFKGDLMWDSVFYFMEPNFPNAITNMKTLADDNQFVVATMATGANFMGTYQPFVYSMDHQGNILWQKTLQIDDHDFNVNLLRSADNGIVVYGRANEFGGSMVSSETSKMGVSGEYGYVYKLDQTGLVEWTKFYADKDTAEFHFSAGDLTVDGDYLFAGNARNNKMMGQGKGVPTSNDNLMNVTRLDGNGDVVWNSALHFNAPLNNSNEYIVRGVNVVDDQNALITFVHYNDIGFDEFGVTSINPLDGMVNWSKLYSDPAQASINIQKVVTMKNGNIVAYYSDYNVPSKSVLLEIDMNGTIVSTNSLNEELHTTFFNDISATDDGGLVITGGLNASNGTMLFKTDKNIKTHCPEESVETMPMTTGLTFDVYSLIDTVFDPGVNESALSPATYSEVQGFNDRYCDCALKVDGTVFDVLGMPTDSVFITLFKFDPLPGEFVVYDTITTDAAGYYAFNYLPEGDYVIKAEPSVDKYPTYLNTYFGMPNEVHQWDSAMTVGLICGFNPVSTNIDLIEGLPQAGAWTCNGYVFEHFGFNPVNKLAPGDPIPDIDITVEQSPGGAISSATTDQDGYYEFTGLNNNATFIVRADIPGLPNDSIYTFTVTPADGALDSLNFYVDSIGVYILPEDLFTSVNNINSNDLSFDIMPNPTRGLVSLVVETEKTKEIDVVITNVVGESIFNNTYRAGSGKTRFPIDLSKYTQGIYFVRITQGEDYLIKKIVKQ